MSKSLALSCEFFPPKTPDMEEKMWSAILQIQKANPLFVSVTYGAAGSTRDNTHTIARRILENTGMKTAAHLTCVGSSRDDIRRMAKTHWDAGIRHIVALRGDPPKGSAHYVPHADGYSYATDMMRGLLEVGAFELSVAAFPEKHPESQSFEQDIEILKIKETIGAKRAITQYFFDNSCYLRLRDRAAKAGIGMPVIPGIIPINNYANIKRFSDMCGTSIPAAIAEKFERLDANPSARDQAAIELATRQCEVLAAEGVNVFHFYTMNRSDIILAVWENLGIIVKELA